MNMPVPPYSFPNMPMMQPSFNVFNKVPMAPPLYIGDLDENIHDETLHDFFSKFGPLHFVRIMRDPATGKSRGFGYVNFLYPRDAESARQYAQYEKLGRKHIRIMFKRNVRDLPFEANIFVKNLDPSVTVKDLHNHFAEIGPILCAKVATNSEGQSLGYGYVQFEKKEDAERAFEALQGSKLKESDVLLSAFVSKDERPETAVKRNIYAKNFPTGLNEEQVSKAIDDVFSQYGEIETKFLKKHPKYNTFSAFICYKDENAAQKAVDDLHAHPRTLDGAEEELYVTWHQGKAERTRDLKRQHQQAQNETNLYVKNLKADVSENDIKKAFQQFGTITSVACKDWTSKDTARKARFGFVAFDNAGDAQRATAKAQEDPEIRNLFLVDATPYIGLHQPKDKRKEYLYSQKKFRSQQAQAQIQTGMMGVPPFGNMPQMPPMAAAGRRFPPFPPMMAQQMRGPPTNRGAPRPHRGGWSRGGGGHRGGMAPRQQGGMGAPQIQQQHQQHPQHTQAQQPQQPRPTGGAKPQMPKQPSATPQQTVPITVQNLRTKLGDFLALDNDKQRQILGELLFPLVKNFSNDVYAPKITGMLIDLSVLEVTEILEFLENPALLQERVQEAVELIQEEDNM